MPKNLQVFSALLEWVKLGRITDQDKDLEILLLRKQPAILGLDNRSLAEITKPDCTSACCDASWSQNDETVYFTNDIMVMTTAGFWCINVNTGTSVTLIRDENDDAFSRVAHLRQLDDGQLYFLHEHG